jgi:hypothetical protein
VSEGKSGGSEVAGIKAAIGKLLKKGPKFIGLFK